MANFLDDYEPVEDRLRDFWSDHPEGRVMTTLVAHGDGDYVVYAEVWRTQGDLPAASGLAHDSVASLPPNMKASALEVCETSAIGRALANLGYAAKGKRPSREEMSKASPAGGPLRGVPTMGGNSSGDSPETRGVGTRVPPAGGTTSTEGEAVVEAGPGEHSSLSPGPAPFGADAETCSHKGASGHWLKTKQVDGVARCPRCGASAVIYRESG